MNSPGSRPIILFRFHDRPEICASRIRFLRGLNGGVPIHGMYGGTDDGFDAIAQEVSSLLDGLSALKGKSGHWLWKHTDLAVREWFRHQGQKLDFDMVHMLEWDVLPASPLGEWGGRMSTDSVGLTALSTVASVEDQWNWVRDEPFRGEWHGLLQWARRKYGYTQEPHCCLGPSYSLPRTFLERFAAETVIELCHSELRLPLLAQCFGFSLCDNGLTPNSVAAQDALFHCGRAEIDPALVVQELHNPLGRRAFHPFRRSYP